MKTNIIRGLAFFFIAIEIVCVGIAHTLSSARPNSFNFWDEFLGVNFAFLIGGVIVSLIYAGAKSIFND